MKLTWTGPEDSLKTARGDIVVCIPVYGGHDFFVACLHSVLAHTPPETKILVCDDASPDLRSREFVGQLGDASDAPHELYYLRREENLGFPANVNGAFEMASPADVVILNSDCIVAAGWLDGLREAASSDSRVATATTLSNNGSIVSVPDRNCPSPTLPGGWTLDQAAAAVRASSLRLRPQLPTAIGHCALIRRSALELVGGFDLTFSPGYGEEVDFSQRCLHFGLSHVLADDVLVFHHGGASFSVNGRPNPLQEAHERVLASRYPYYHHAVRELEDDSSGPLARALSSARRTLKGLTVVIDARILTGPMTGTQLQVLEVIAALARTGQLHITAIVPKELGDYAERVLAALPEVRLLEREALDDELVRADLVHRPYQVANDEDIAFLAPLGERLIITNQDLISYHNPSYFLSSGGWLAYRRLTRMALAVADHVVFISGHARDEALADDMLDPARASIVPNGVDHTLGGHAASPAVPRGLEHLEESAEVILCLGTDFRHKNRMFALRLLHELRERHGWAGSLVMAGPHVVRGGSTADEAGYLALHPTVADGLIELAAVTEAEKAWLYQRCSLVLYPTVHEGFGLVPFEASDHDRPCLWAPVTSLAEVLPPEAAGIVPWSVELAASRALELIRDGASRTANLEAIREAGRSLSWDRAAAELIRIYRETCDAPAAPGSADERRHGLMGGLLSQDAVRLLGPEGALPTDVERPLLALTTHPQLSAPLFRAIKLGYRAGYVWRRRLSRASDRPPSR